MAEVFRCRSNPEYDEFMRRFIAYVVHTRAIEASG